MFYLTVLSLAFLQNVAFTMVSRSRNRDHYGYHAACSIASNGLWFATMHALVISDISPVLAVPYIAGTVAGSLSGQYLSMRVERFLKL